MIRPPPTSTLFPYTTLFRSDVARRQARLRAPVSDPLRRPHPARGRDSDHGGRQHLVLHRREHDPRGGARRSLRPGARASVGPLLDAPCCPRDGLPAALAVPVRDTRHLQAAVHVRRSPCPGVMPATWILTGWFPCGRR